MKEFTHIEVFPNSRVINPDKTKMICEAPNCRNEILIGISYSFKISVATTGPTPIRAFECIEEQHFACSPECAKEAGIMCMDHLIERLKEMEKENVDNG